MTKNHKFMLSLATIAILSGTNAAAAELKVDTADNTLKLGTDPVTITNGKASVTPAKDKESEAIEVKSTIPSSLGSATMTDLTIKAPQAELKVGDGSTGGSLGGTAPTGEASTDGYGFTIDASKVTLTGKDASNNAELNVNANSTITTSDTAGTNLGANSSISIANGKNLTINGNLTTGETSSSISVGGGSLNLSGNLTATNGNISLGSGGTLTTNGELKQTGATINLGGGVLNVNGGGSLDGTKLTLTNGGTLNFNAASGASADKPTTSTISGKVESTADNALNITIGRNTKVSFTDETDGLNLKNASDTVLDKITLGGGVLEVKKLIADITNLDINSGGTINFTGDGSTISSNPDDTLTLGSGTTFHFKGTNGTEKTTFENSLTTNGGKLNFNNATMNVKNLTTSVGDLSFDKTNGGTIELANGGKSTISGNLELGDKANIKIISAAGGATAGTLSVGSLSVTKTGKLTLGGGKLDVANGLTIANAGATADTDGNSNNIDISAGGVINFNGGTSTIGGELKTTANKATTLDVNQGANVNFENLNLLASGVLSLDGGVVNVGKLTTAEAGNLSLTKGTLNFIGDSTSQTPTTSSIESLTLADDSTAVLNFGENSAVTIKNDDLDLGKTSAVLNFNKGSLVTMGGTNATLTARTLNLKGGQINLKKLVASTSESSETLNLAFVGASVGVKGNLSNDTNAFTIGTDDKGNHFIGKENEEIKISADSSLALNSGTINVNGKLTTDATATGKLIFGGGSLNIGESGKLTITKTSDNLEFKEGAGGWLTLKGDGTKGATATIAKGNLDLSKTSMGISIEKGAKLTTTEASKISGENNLIQLGKYAGISIDGDITTAAGGTFEAYKIGSDLTLGKGTKLRVLTLNNESNELQEITAGKLSTKDSTNQINTATLIFGNSGALNLTGEINSGAKLNNIGFGNDITLADNSVLEFISGSVNVKGSLNAATKDNATLRVSNATANLNGGLGANMTKIELNSGGALNIKGDYTGDGLNVAANGGVINVTGTASITNSTFTIVADEASAGSMLVLTTTKGLTLDTASKGEFKVRKSLNDILGKYGLSLSDTEKQGLAADNQQGDKKAEIADSSVNVEVKKSDDEKNLNLIATIVSGSSSTSLDGSSLKSLLSSSKNNEKTSMENDKKILAKMDEAATGLVKTNDTLKDGVIKGLEEKIAAKDKEATDASNKDDLTIAREIGGGGVDTDILLSAYSSRIDASQIGIDMLANGGKGIVADIKDAAITAQNTASPTASVTTAVNLSNDMAIGGRIAQANNPFANYASYDGLLFAALESDLPLYYANNGYMNGFWANAVGGLNRIDGENGFLGGLSVGFDRQLDNALLGFYLSYAMATLNDKVVDQSSHNIQVGFYASFNQRDVETNVKIYGQAAVTDQTTYKGVDKGDEGTEAKFVRQFAGISANIGKIFDFNQNSTFVKPFIGENYYYTYTPAYEESGNAAVKVNSINNHALSFDIGVDVRQYFSQNGFVYATPKIERYVVNNGGEYTAGFIGSDTTFTIAGKSKTKTYGQLLMGGNIDITRNLNVNLGLGVRKILMGQVTNANGDSVDELYISGNLGVKYRF